MSMLRRRGHRVAVWLTVACFAVTSCGSVNPLGGASTNVNSIVVGSAGFPESKILAEIYAQALQTNGFNVGREMGIGSRETYVPALKDHSIDLVPEYVGNLLSYFEPRATVTMLDDIEPSSLYRLFDDALAAVETAGALPSLTSLDGYTLIALDGTQYFCSNKLSCRNCSTRKTAILILKKRHEGSGGAT